MSNNAKESLYRDIDAMRENLGIHCNDYYMYAPLFCKQYYCSRIELKQHEFKDDRFCGASYAGRKQDTIVLNSSHSPEEQNFDCAHELVHLYLHRPFYTDGRYTHQDTFMEWEANEGAAELLIPYRGFIPRFSRLFDSGMERIPYYLAGKYQVTPRVIEVRVDSLSYEIDQYRSGVPINEIELLSKRCRHRQGISTTPYNAVMDFAFDWNDTIGWKDSIAAQYQFEYN